MVYFPRTLPKSLFLELGDQSDYRNYDDLVVKLEKKPQNLLVFLCAAMQSIDCWSKNQTLIRCLVSKITDKVLINILPFDQSVRVCNQLFKFYAFANGLVSDFTIFQMTHGKRYCRLVLMNASPVLREFFYSNPAVNFVLHLSLAEYLLNLEEFNLLYSIFVTGSYHHCYNIETTSLQRLIHQAKAWECDKVCD